ncbi:hypothetical protein [Trueperella bialowiezensis]|uniref:TadE-like protein n=1 Tax=Trueperella bialowiezensis TaxID=312285 RepID=A0A448PGC4_9ACTO|nr:hypothetical protein [Trueperella bialowiezensis]VEI13958.1 Uncharacterised protein [Trueperella bialowiezensis]
MRSTESSASEQGNATVGFVATVGLLLMTVYTIIVASLAWYVHAIATDSALEGARAGAISKSEQVAVARTRDLMTSTLNPSYGANITASMNAGTVHVVVRTPIPGAGFLGPTAIEVHAHAAAE